MTETPNLGVRDLQANDSSCSRGWYYKISVRRIWISSAQVASTMIHLARTFRLEVVEKPSEGLSLGFTDFDTSAPV